MLRTIAIWVFGLLASAIFGGLLGAYLLEGGASLGMIGSVALFVCVRLWLSLPQHYPRDPRNQQRRPITGSGVSTRQGLLNT